MKATTNTTQTKINLDKLNFKNKKKPFCDASGKSRTFRTVYIPEI